MITIRANIKLYSGDRKRKIPFFSGYRPLFSFTEMRKSGQITLLNIDDFKPGEEHIVEILFINTDYLGSDFSIGKKFTFAEAEEILGEGVVLEIISGKSQLKR